MESALAIWNRRQDAAWLAGIDPAEFRARVAQRQSKLVAGSRILVCDADPIDFLAGFFAVVTHDQPVEVFLGSSRWSAAETEHALAIARPSVVWGAEPCDDLSSGAGSARDARRCIMIPTGGTMGGLRFAMHTWESISAAAYGLQEWLGGGPINSVCFLPLHHVSGLMQVVRSFITDGALTLANWSKIERGACPATGRERTVTSLVPTQLERLRRVPGAVAWLRSFDCVFIGGARANAGLLSWAREERIRLAPSYGMTETAAQVATMRPEAFLAGEAVEAEVLPHVAIAVVDEAELEPVPPGTAGRLVITTPALFRGYYPEWNEPSSSFITDDRGVLHSSHRVSVLGRIDAVINTGGEKVDPAEVEQAIVATGLVQAAVVFGVPDKEWGEIVVAAVVGATGGDGRLMEHLREQLTGYKWPKRWLHVEALPTNASGKVDLAALRELLR